MESLTGWVCPKCGKVYSPFMPECSHCNGSMNVAPIEPPKKINIDNKEEMDKYLAECLGMSQKVFDEWTEGESYGPKEGGV